MRYLHRLALPLCLMVLTAAALALAGPAWAQRVCTPAFDFEDGTLQGFTVQPVAGLPLWHNANNVCAANLPGHSLTHTLYYGQDGTCDYSTGARNASNVVSPALLTGAFNHPITLEFNYLVSVENTPDFDQTFGEVSSDGGATWRHAFSKSDLINDTEWHSKVVNLTTGVLPLGVPPPTNVRFLFDSRDDLFNGTIGWHLDDVQVCGIIAAPPIPTLSTLGMMILVLLLAGTSMFLLRRRRQAGA